MARDPRAPGAHQVCPSLERLALWVTLAALVVRLGYVWAQLEWDLFRVATMAPDSERYLALARSLAQGQGLSFGDGLPTAADLPGYPLFLALVLHGLGLGLVGLYVIQAALGAATVWLVHRLGSLVYTPRAGLVAALFCAVSPLQFIFTASPLTEVLYTFLAVLFLYALAAMGRRPLGGLRAGLAGGLAIMTRPVLAPFAFLVALWRLARPATRRAAVMLCLGVLVLVGPWIARNWLIWGDFIPLTSRGGFEFYLGNAADSTGGAGGHLQWGIDVAAPPEPAPGETPQAHAGRLAALAWDYLRGHPVAALSRLPGKIWNLWRPTWAGASPRNWLIMGGLYVLATGLALAGIFLPGARGGSGLMWGYLLYHLVLHAVVFGIVRYRVPVEPALYVLAGGTVAQLWPGSGRPGEVAA